MSTFVEGDLVRYVPGDAVPRYLVVVPKPMWYLGGQEDTMALTKDVMTRKLFWFALTALVPGWGEREV